MSDFTPGPWQTRFLYRMIRAARETPGLLMGSPPENDWADARLMAQSPDMYALLREFGGHGGDGFCETCGRDIASGAGHAGSCRLNAILKAVEAD